MSYEQQLQLVANQGGQQPQQFLQQQSQIQQVQVQNTNNNVQAAPPAAPVQNYNIEYKSKEAQQQEKEEQKEAKAVESVMKDRSFPESTPDKPDVPINAQFVFHTSGFVKFSYFVLNIQLLGLARLLPRLSRQNPGF